MVAGGFLQEQGAVRAAHGENATVIVSQVE